MKKYYLLLALLVVSISAFAQKPEGFDDSYGRYFEDVPDDEDADGQLMYNQEKDYYVYVFDLTTVGATHSWRKLNEILELNDLDKEPNKDRSVYNSKVRFSKDGEYDFKELKFYSSIQEIEIEQGWYSNNWVIIWSVDDDFARVIASKLED